MSLTSEQFSGTESSGLVEVMVMMEGGTSTSPISVIVTPSEQSLVSATGTALRLKAQKFTLPEFPKNFFH